MRRIGVIDIGFTKVAALVVEEELPGRVRVLGKGVEEPEGFKEGMPVDLDRALSTLRSSLKKAEGQGIRFKKLPVYVGINGRYVRYTRCEASIRRKSPREPISEREVRLVRREAHSMRQPPDERFLHLVPLSFSLDDMRGAQNPKGFRDCHRLGVEGLLVHGKTMVLSSLEQLLDMLEIRERRFVFQPLAQCLTVTEPKDREVGVGLIDLGGWTTVSVYKGGELVHFGIVDMGGEDVTNDLASVLRVRREAAEALKREAGAIKCFVAGKDEVIPLPETAGGEKYVSRQIVAEIVESRLEEILVECRKDIASQGYGYSLPAGIVLGGGGAKVPGIAPFASRILGVPSKVGIPEGVPDEFQDPVWSTAFGLARFGFAGLYERYSLVGEDDVITRARQWVKRLLRIGEEE